MQSVDSVQRAVSNARDMQQAVLARITGLESSLRESQRRGDRIEEENLELTRANEEQAETIRRLERDVAEGSRRLERAMSDLSTVNAKLTEANNLAAIAQAESTTSNEVAESLREEIGNLRHNIEDMTSERDLAVGQLTSFTNAFAVPFFGQGEATSGSGEAAHDDLAASEDRVTKDVRSRFGAGTEDRAGRAA